METAGDLSPCTWPPPWPWLFLIYIGFRARWPAARRAPDPGPLPAWSGPPPGCYLQMLVGSTVTGHHAGLAYLLNGLPDLGPGVARIQLAHRTSAAMVGALVVAR